ncbi:hypothetical protein [Halosimplex amylolyticum]|uniref:hypothetical protein n=1 Tax=Halosimplex amylolyticum TaxID=3396616 RepID=UPI003F54C13E
MTNTSNSSIEPEASQHRDQTSWRRLADAEPIEIRDPLAELLGMVPNGEPLTVTFADVAKAAGHACPAVSGAYRSTQLALDELYPESYPVRSDINVVVGDAPDAAGYGPMANVMRHITGATDETGFSGFNGFGGRDNRLSFEEIPGPGRSFEFKRVDTEETVRITFTPSATKPESANGSPEVKEQIARLVQGDLSDEERDAFYETWHTRVQMILQADPGPDTPFSMERDDSSG